MPALPDRRSLPLQSQDDLIFRSFQPTPAMRTKSQTRIGRRGILQIKPKVEGCRSRNAMNYKMAIIIMGGLLLVAAMIPYAYQPRCTTAECTPERPY
jgi:hypothetical protein